MNYAELERSVQYGPDRSREEWQAIFYQHDLTGVDEEVLKFYSQLLKTRFGCPVWRTQDMRLIPMDYMKPSHLANAFNVNIKQVRDLYGESCKYRFSDPNIALLYAKALDVERSIKSICVAQHQQGYEPTDDDLKKLQGVVMTLKMWFPTGYDYEDEEFDLD